MMYSIKTVYVMHNILLVVLITKPVVPNLGVATPKGVVEHFKGGREAVANATAKVNVDRTGCRSDCFDECHFSLGHFIRKAL